MPPQVETPKKDKSHIYHFILSTTFLILVPITIFLPRLMGCKGIGCLPFVAVCLVGGLTFFILGFVFFMFGLSAKKALKSPQSAKKRSSPIGILIAGSLVILVGYFEVFETFLPEGKIAEFFVLLPWNVPFYIVGGVLLLAGLAQMIAKIIEEPLIK